MAICWQRRLEEDIHKNLRRKEKLLPVFHGQSPQLSQRRYLVDWLSIIWDKHKICPTARQLSISLLDYFMDMFDIEERQLQLVALGSFLVATKFEEQDVAIPRISDLRKDMPDLRYTGREFLQMELLLLDFYGWNVGFPTTAHFTAYFLEYALATTDRLHGKLLPPRHQIKQHVEKYTAYFLEISMQEHFFRDFLPSRVASASIACSRVCLCIEPSWNEQLIQLTEYSMSDLSVLMESMLRTHSQDEMLQTVPPTPPATPKQSQTQTMGPVGYRTPHAQKIPTMACTLDTPSTPSHPY